MCAYIEIFHFAKMRDFKLYPRFKCFYFISELHEDFSVI